MPFKTPIGGHEARGDRDVTWTDGPATLLFRCEVQLVGQRLMQAQIRALNSRQAKTFALRRWGKEAQIKMLGRVK